MYIKKLIRIKICKIKLSKNDFYWGYKVILTSMKKITNINYKDDKIISQNSDILTDNFRMSNWNQRTCVSIEICLN